MFKVIPSSIILHSIEVQSHAWNVREADCVTRQACPSHHCVPQDTTVLQGPLLLDPVPLSVSVC